MSHDAIRAWRAFCSDADRLEDMRRHAIDLLADHSDRVGAVDPDFEALTVAERERYLADLADSLAAGMLRCIGLWVVNDFQLVADWKGSR